jgi:hypothetical protein
MNGFIDNNNDTFYTQSFVSRSITADVVAKGLVIGYLGYPDGTGDTVVENASEFAPTLQQLFVTDSIVVQSFGGTSGPYFNYDPSSGSGFLYRYVIIPGNVAAGTSINGLTQAQLKKISYPDLTKALNTPVKSAAAPTTVN